MQSITAKLWPGRASVTDISHPGLDKVRLNVDRAAEAAGRDPLSVTVIAVSKTFAAVDILPVIAAGQIDFGENRVQEAKTKWPSLTKPGLKLHLIGPLQSNKAAEAVALFDAIHTVDRPKIAAALCLEMQRQKRQLELFVQINTGREAQKAGIDPEVADSFIEDCRNRYGLVISGLMCIPPAAENPEPHFRMLADIAGRHGLNGLSMGMSSDYEIAVKCGATHIRVGSAIFGSRPSAVR